MSHEKMSDDQSSPVYRSETRQPFLRPKLVFGLVLTFLGLVLTLDRLDLLDAGAIFVWFGGWWPMLLVLAGLAKILWPAAGGASRFSGVLLVLIGLGLGLEIHGYLPFSLWDLWPLLLVLFGLRMAWRSFVPSSPGEGVEIDGSSVVTAVAALGGATRTNGSQDFRGGDLYAFMGGVEIDLTRAKIAQSPAVIDAMAMWGGVEIRVPEDWSVEVRGLALMGGYEDKTRPPMDGASQQHLVLKGIALMGGVEIKN